MLCLLSESMWIPTGNSHCSWLTPQLMENEGWEVGEAEFLVIMQGNQLSNQSKSPSHMPVRNF